MRMFETDLLPPGLLAATVSLPDGIREDVHILRVSPHTLTLRLTGFSALPTSADVHFFREDHTFTTIHAELSPLDGNADEADFAVAENPAYAAEVRRLEKCYAGYVERRQSDPDALCFADARTLSDRAREILDAPDLPETFDDALNALSERFFGSVPKTIFLHPVYFALNTPDAVERFAENPEYPTERLRSLFPASYRTVVKASGVTLGSRICQKLLPSADTLARAVRRAADAGLAVSLVLPPMKTGEETFFADYLSALPPEIHEIEVNDWGLQQLCAERFPNRFSLTMGYFLNRRWIDPRAGLFLPEALYLPPGGLSDDTEAARFLRSLGFGRAVYPGSLPEPRTSIIPFPLEPIADDRESAVFLTGLLPVSSGRECSICAKDCRTDVRLYDPRIGLIGCGNTIHALTEWRSRPHGRVAIEWL